MKKAFSAIIVLILVLPMLSQAAILPDCGFATNNQLPRECGYADLFTLFNNIVDFLVLLAIPIAALVFAISGFEYMMTGVADKRAEANKRMIKVAKGLFFVLAAWLIVNTILDALIDPGNTALKNAIPVGR